MWTGVGVASLMCVIENEFHGSIIKVYHKGGAQQKDTTKAKAIVACQTWIGVLDIEANWFYDRNHQMYEAALLTRCYTQHALRPFIDAEINHQRHFIKIPFINK